MQSFAVTFICAIAALGAGCSPVTSIAPDGARPDGKVVVGPDGGGGQPDSGLDGGQPDSGQPDGGHSVPPNIMFVTSATFSANLGGLSGADAKCQAAATAGGLQGTYVAWLSTNSVNAIDRLSGATGWVRTDGIPFARTPADIANGAILSPPSLDESGNPVSAGTTGYPFTDTDANGTLFANSDGTTSTCKDWTSTTPTGVNFITGDISQTTFRWTNSYFADCDHQGHLYCFGVDRKGTVSITPASGRLAFVSSAQYTPGTGIAGADDLCAKEAATAGKVGSFKALLVTNGAGAGARFDQTKAPWVRPDGLAIAATATDLFSGKWDVPINETLSGTYTSAGVWTGIAQSLTKPGTSATTCNNWMASGTSNTGAIVEASTTQPGTGNAPCNLAFNVYCLQE